MVPFDVYGAILNNRRLLPRPSQQLRSLARLSRSQPNGTAQVTAFLDCY
jgi:hypothetical protein